ncbi:hypothetical protein PO124_33970 [Bacillus licheniformis]|nr:hypothetical protein [Bacillus licheniformis]
MTAAGVPLSAELTEFNITPYRHLIMSLAMLSSPDSRCHVGVYPA